MNDTTGELRTAIEAIKYPVVAGLKHYPEDIPIDVKHMVPVEVVDAIIALLAAQRQRWEAAARKDELKWAVAYVQSDLGADFVEKGRKRIATLDGELGKEQSNANQ